MATVSMHKDFIVRDKKTYKAFKKNVNRKQYLNKPTTQNSPSLERGEEKLKRFSFH